MTTLSDKLSTLMTTLQLEDLPAGGSIVVYHKGKQVGQASIGQATPNETWSSNTLSLNFSTGKNILVTLIHVLVSNGLLDYDTPIADYWPEFAANGKLDITLKSVLTHRAGLFNVQAITQQTSDVLQWAKMLHSVEMMQPEKPENNSAESCYSALVIGWVLGGLIEKVTGLNLNTALNQYLAKPLGVENQMYFGMPADKVRQVATLTKHFDDFDGFASDVQPHSVQSHIKTSPTSKTKPQRYKSTFRPDTKAVLQAYQTLPSYHCWQRLIQQQVSKSQDDRKTSAFTVGLTTLDIARLYLSLSNVNLSDFKHALMPTGLKPLDYYAPDTLMATIPAANGVASAQALAKMMSMLAGKGVWQGETLIQPNVFDELSKVYVTGSDAIMPATHPKSMQWRLGYHRLFSCCHSLRSDRTTTMANISNAFGHMGYNGSVAWCDTDRELAVVYVHNYDATMSTDIRQFAITEAILQWYEAGAIA